MRGTGDMIRKDIEEGTGGEIRLKRQGSKQGREV